MSEHLVSASGGADSWQSPKASTDSPRPATFSMDLDLPVQLFPTGWTNALKRPPKVNVQSQTVEVPAPRVVSVRIREPAVRVASYRFAEPAGPVAERPAATAPPAGSPGAAAHRLKMRGGGTRIAPPGDIVKLQDRLYYLLQPPLESLVGCGQLSFPFEPFTYQLQGVAFLYPRYAAVLADEMGLGKTMQAITTIRLLLRAGEIRSVLLICPKPLVTNWKREFALWAPEIPVAVLQGDQQRRRWLWQQPNQPVRIANYELLLRDADVLCSRQQPLDLVVLDEAQRIKNRTSTTSQVARAIPRQRCWALTGTPIENSPEDLVAIFDFLLPGYLRPGMEPRRIGRATGDHVLRRTKNHVLTDLPPKLYRDAELDLSDAQRETYRTAEQKGVVRLADMGQKLTIQHVFELVLRLKQICNFDPATGASSKLERLEADLEEVSASDQKAIVFSQWVQTLQWLNQRLSRYRPLEYHGKIPPRQRDSIIDRFRQDPSRRVLLMSYGAGSVGLNLQFCSYVFLFDRWWNPAVEDQAINRAHRIGAKGPVTVTRMLTLDTIEQRIDQVLQEKRELFQAVFSQTGQHAAQSLSQEEIFGLFNLQLPASGNLSADKAA
jgi:SNF2 family DNA or RNA helicase